jgi:hypothetical protein
MLLHLAKLLYKDIPLLKSFIVPGDIFCSFTLVCLNFVFHACYLIFSLGECRLQLFELDHVFRVGLLLKKRLLNQLIKVPLKFVPFAFDHL